MIVICGTPGTGKTSLARALEQCGFKHVSLAEFVIKRKLYSGYDRRRSAYIIDPEKLVPAILEEARRSERPLVVEGVGADLIPPEYVDACIVLICEPGELEMRLRSRGYPEEKIQENVDAERLNVAWGEALDAYGSEKVIVIDTTGKEPEEVFEEAVAELERRGLIESGQCGRAQNN